MESKKEVRSRGWIFVVNNYTDDDLIHIHWMYENDWNASYIVIGYEKGSRSKQPHLQCYAYYNEALSWSKFKKIAPLNCHIEAQKASKNVEAYCYCLKDGQYVEFGERPRQGHRTDLEVIKHDIEAGRPIRDIAQNYFAQWCQYGKRFDAYIDLIKQKYDTKLCWYDRTQPMSQLRIIKTEYVDYFIVKDVLPWLEICEICISGRYKTVFVPNFPGYSDYMDDVELSIIKINPIDINAEI